MFSIFCRTVFFGTVFFRAFDHVAIGITLTLTTVAATTLTAGAAARAVAFATVVAFLVLVIDLLFVEQHFLFAHGSRGLFGAWLTFFARRARLAFFAWCAFRTLFTSKVYGRGCIQRLAQFADRTIFACFTWLALAGSTGWTLFTWC